jgi:hypothetical protein
MFLKVNTWSQQPLPFLNPACSCLILASIAVFILLIIILLKILVGIDSKVIPLQLLQLDRSPFFGSFIIFPLDYVVGIMLLFQILVNNGCKMSAARIGFALNNSAGS